MLIETERLSMRPVSSGDLEDLVAMHEDPKVQEVWGASPRPEVEAWIERAEREWEERGHGRLTVLDRETGEFLGRCGLRFWNELGEVEVGWSLRPEARGRGVATEAARACLEWGFRDLDVPYITAMIGPENADSRAVAERLGMSPRREDVIYDEAVIIYSLDRGA